MQLRHIGLAFLVVAIWGFNFIFIHYALLDLPPLLLCAVRFFFAAIPAIFFVPRPRGSWKLLLGYGLATYAFQFSFLFTGMKVGMAPGLASLVMQMQTFFTLGLAMWIFREKPTLWKVAGALISFLGIVLVGLHSEGDTTLAGLVLTLLAAFSWASGNIFSKKVDAVSPIGLVVWGSLLAAPFLTVISFFVDGPVVIQESLSQVSWLSVMSVAYIVYLSTHVAYSLWGFLLNTYPTAIIAPFPLLVPVFGFLGSTLLLGETFPVWKVWASLLVIFGLVFNLLEAPIRRRLLKNV